MRKTPIQTVEVPINDLIPADYNPRKHDELASEQLTHSILYLQIILLHMSRFTLCHQQTE
jgi:hypothetical protein